MHTLSRKKKPTNIAANGGKKRSGRESFVVSKLHQRMPKFQPPFSILASSVFRSDDPVAVAIAIVAVIGAAFALSTPIFTHTCTRTDKRRKGKNKKKKCLREIDGEKWSSKPLYICNRVIPFLCVRFFVVVGLLYMHGKNNEYMGRCSIKTIPSSLLLSLFASPSRDSSDERSPPKTIIIVCVYMYVYR